MQLRSRPRVMSMLGIAGIATALLGVSANGQDFVEGPPPKQHQKQPDLVGTTLDFPVGEYQGINIQTGRSINMSPKPKVVWEDVLRVDNVAWLRLYFANVHLEGDSFIRVTSLHDGEVQELNADTVAMWSDTTAYFNGNALKIELVAGSFTIDNEFQITEYAYEIGVADRGDGCGICGNDDRAPSSDNNFARLFPVGCSATVHNEDSCMVTAGHCLTGGSAVVQFNVPSSNSDCSTNNPPVADQFPVTNESGLNGGVGFDYGALSIGTNSLGERPYDRYNTFIPLATSIPGSGNMSNHGYGVDSQCDRSQVQQTHSGPISYVDSTTVVYDIDVTYGNSGSSLVYNGEIIGVVTHCSYGCENYGTRIDTSGFAQAIGVICNGDDPPPPGECAPGEIEDCFGSCCPATWVGDGYCDDGSYPYNGVPIYLNCDEFDCDGGDCPPESCGDGGGDPTGACCFTDGTCADVTNAECNTFGGSYQGDGTSCASDPCGGGGGGDGDSCNNPVDAFEGANPFDTTSNSDSGFGEPDESQCDGTYLDWTASPDHWFRFVPSGSGTANFTTCDAGSYDTSMVLYRGSSCNSLTQVACNGDGAADGSCQTYHSQIDGIAVTAGETYYIRIGGWQAATGTGTLTISTDFGSDPIGACCMLMGGEKTCVGDQTEADCTEFGSGDWQGAGTSCSDPNPCNLPGGACCFGSTCEIYEEAFACGNSGGDYLGDGTTCDPNPCGGGGGDGQAYLEIAGIDSYDGYQSGVNVIQTITIPAGANITGIGWEDVTLSAYDPSWGSEAGIMFNWENDGEPFAGYTLIFEGEDAPGDYGPVTGFEDLTADWNFSDADGEIQIEFFETYDDAAGVVDGTWTGGRIYVVHDGDGGSDPIGACCMLMGGEKTCVGDQTEADCTEFGSGDWQGAGTSCSDPNPCNLPGGACCFGSYCEFFEEAFACGNSGGSYQGDGTTCDSNPCPDDPFGACCFGGDTCELSPAEYKCNLDGGTWNGAPSCSPNPCEDTPASGACCLGTDCYAATSDECGNAGGTYQGDNTSCNNVECGDSDAIEVSHSIIGTGLLLTDDPHYTVDIYVSMPADHRLDAVAGTPDQDKTLVSTGGFFQSDSGGPTSRDVNPAFYDFDQDLEFDSRITIGSIDSTGNPFDGNPLQDIGIDWDAFEAGGGLSADNGLWFILPTDEHGEAQPYTAQDCSQRYGVLVARVTTMGLDSEISFGAHIQGRDAAGNIFTRDVEYNFGYSPTEDCNGNLVSDTCDIANGTSDDANGNGIPDECDNLCPGDVDGDGDADVDDILAVIGNYGNAGGDGDADGDGDVDVDDILLVLNSFGNC
ncbi:MAG: hypothetical protein MK116_06520 [Phycisphaerales bacterium]|nr:hypothetical protein [Phycisphaerales bacterium]